MNLSLQNHETFPIKGHRQLNVELLNGADSLFSMLYDAPLHTARIESKGTRRMFMVYTEGKRMPKHVFKNEYGFDVGLIDPQAAYNNYGCVQLYGILFITILILLQQHYYLSIVFLTRQRCSQ